MVGEQNLRDYGLPLRQPELNAAGLPRKDFPSKVRPRSGVVLAIN